MKRGKGRIKLICAITFAMAAAIVVLFDTDRMVQPIDAFSGGPPPGHTGAPGESTCTDCHFGEAVSGTFTITAPGNYVPGQTYQVVVQHAAVGPRRWGFQLITLAGPSMAGSFAPINASTQIVGGAAGRNYIQHTASGTFAGQANGAIWGFNWTAPATNVGPITFYAAGNQANNDGGSSGDWIVTTTTTSQPPPVDPPGNAPFDFDGDGKTDIGIFRPGPGQWWINRSSNSQTFAAQFGNSDDKIVPGDFTGDGKADIALWRPSTGFWFVLRSEDFSYFAFPFGTMGDVALAADFDGDTKTDATIYRPSSSLWFILKSTGGTDILTFGIAGDQPVPADYDGDGKADLAIRRPNGANGAEWWINRSTAGILAAQFGVASDLNVQGDYTGDGKIDVAFWRPATGFWFVLRSEDHSFYSVPFGTTGDLPAPGDYDGDGKSDTAIFRPSETNWYINRSTAGVLIQQFGASGDKPIPSAFVQ